MKPLRRIGTCLLLSSSIAILVPRSGVAQQGASGPAKNATGAPARRDGRRDFDFEIGTWKTHVRRLVRPLSGSRTWVELDGTSVVRKLLDGSANLVELDVAGPSGRIRGVSLRLYNPESGQWSLHYASMSGGVLGPPTIGEFVNGRGEFFGQETVDGRSIYVRFVITCPTSKLCRFEQAFSGDGGKTWELNWVATDTRVDTGSAASP